MAIKLHYHPLSTYSRRVLIALIEKQIAYEPVPIDMVARKHRESAYLALNPYGRVPTLEENGFVLYESTAILEYLEVTHPAPSQFRLYVYDGYSRPFIPRGFTSRIVVGEVGIPFKPAAGGAFLEARMTQTALPATIVVKARFEDKQPEYRFDFQFYDYSKEPK